MIWTGKTVVFDLDGTLVDTAPDLHAALCFAYSTLNIEAIDLETVRGSIGQGARAMILKSAALTGHDLTDDMVSQLHAAFLDYYMANMTVHSALFPGIGETLRTCRVNGARLAVCTNKTQQLAEQVLSELGIIDLFSAIVGADSASEKKPSARHLLETIALAGGLTDQAVMIGDSSSDGFSAAAAGVPFIFVTYGYPDEHSGKLAPDITLQDATELPGAISALFS